MSNIRLNCCPSGWRKLNSRCPRISLGALSAPNRRRALGQQRGRGQAKNSGANISLLPEGGAHGRRDTRSLSHQGREIRISLGISAAHPIIHLHYPDLGTPCDPKTNSHCAAEKCWRCFLSLAALFSPAERERGFIWPPPGHHTARVLLPADDDAPLYNGEIIFSARQKRGRRGVRVKYCVIATRFLPREPAREAAERVIRSRGVDQVQWENEPNGRSLARNSGRKIAFAQSLDVFVVCAHPAQSCSFFLISTQSYRSFYPLSALFADGILYFELFVCSLIFNYGFGLYL